MYLAEDARREMGLHREDLVALAYFLGSDYAEGVQGVGIVNAVEIVHAFPMKFTSSSSNNNSGSSSSPSSSSSCKAQMHREAASEEVEAELLSGESGPLAGLRRFKEWLRGYDFGGDFLRLEQERRSSSGDNNNSGGDKAQHATDGDADAVDATAIMKSSNNGNTEDNLVSVVHILNFCVCSAVHEYSACDSLSHPHHLPLPLHLPPT